MVCLNGVFIQYQSTMQHSASWYICAIEQSHEISTYPIKRGWIEQSHEISMYPIKRGWIEQSSSAVSARTELSRPPSRFLLFEHIHNSSTAWWEWRKLYGNVDESASSKGTSDLQLSSGTLWRTFLQQPSFSFSFSFENMISDLVIIFHVYTSASDVVNMKGN